MRVLALPAFRNKEANPYNYLLYSALSSLGVQVSEFSPEQLLRRYEVLHVHWPELVLNARPYTRALLRTKVFLLALRIARMRGMKIIWTVHNLKSHEMLYPNLEKRFWKEFLRMVDGYISLTKTGKMLLLERYPFLRQVPGFVIPHGHYRGIYPNNVGKEEARKFLNIPPKSKVLLFIGQIRRYKNIPTLIQTFKELSDPNSYLVVAGKPVDVQLAEEIRHEAAGDPRIKLFLEFIPRDKIQFFLNSSDVVVLPYSEILNSGSAILALSFDRPVLVPKKGSMAELQEEVGKEWVMTFKDDLTPEILESALKWAISGHRPPHAPLEAFDWGGIAKKTLEAYWRVIHET